MKKLLLLALILIFWGCSPSKVAPSISTVTIAGIPTSRTINIPVPEAYSFKLGANWSVRQDLFVLEEQLMAFTFIKGNEEISLRGGKKNFLYKDSSFSIDINASDEDFVNYYLKWDFDYVASKHEIVDQAQTTGPVYDSEKRFGYIKSINDKYQRCVMASIVNESIYMLTGRAVDSDKDVCTTLFNIWENRKPF